MFGFRGRGRWLGRWFLVFIIVIVLDYELRLLFADLGFRRTVVFYFFLLPENFEFEVGGFAVYFKDNGQHPLENAKAIEDLFGRIAF